MPAKKKTQAALPKLNLQDWEDRTIGDIFQVTLKVRHLWMAAVGKAHSRAAFIRKRSLSGAGMKLFG